ncbi:MAG: hypothetical protein OEY14_08905, partial [Myxococcales bacterium]|nr:hypothetical protein [Myxococcales bacterium]
PLDDHPAAAMLLHALVWPATILALRWLLVWLRRRDPVVWTTPRGSLPWYFRASGATSARGVDARFRRLMGVWIVILFPITAACGALLALGSGPRAPALGSLLALGSEAGGDGLQTPDPIEALRHLRGLEGLQGLEGLEELEGPSGEGDPDSAALEPRGLEAAASLPRPSAGLWMLSHLLLLFAGLALLARGRAPLGESAEAEAEAEASEPEPDPLARLSAALQALRPGVRLVPMRRLRAQPADSLPLPAGLSPLARELFVEMTGSTEAYAHQAELLEHLTAAFELRAAAIRGAPSLGEERFRSPVHAIGESPHALVIAPEGSGRTTAAITAALHVHLDRGATTLVIVRDGEAAQAWVARLREALASTSARWSLDAIAADEELASALLLERRPAIVVAGLEQLEGTILGDPRTDPFLAKLGLVIADDLDAFTGVAEMHLHLVMRRLWALLEGLHRLLARPLLLAICGPSAAGMEAWARHVLAQPLRLFERDGAPRPLQVWLRRRDLFDLDGEPIPLALLAEACDHASIPWHLRFAGDRGRMLRRAEMDLGRLRRSHVSDPLDASVILLEGNHPDVRREAARLCHAGARTGLPVALILAAPVEQELVLHEEAVDGAHRPLLEGLPHAITLCEPDLVRQRHIDRALGREQPVEALRAHLGAALVDEVLERLETSGRVQAREVFVFDAERDALALQRRVRASSEEGLGEPIDAECVGDAQGRVSVLEAGTSLLLRRLDGAIAPALLPPGAIFLHPRGRFRRLEGSGETLLAERLGEVLRSALERSLRVEPGPERFAERELGGAAIGVFTSRGFVEERIDGVRLYRPGPERVEERRFTEPPRAACATDLCLLFFGEETRSAALAPIVAALRMVLPCHLRAAEELIDADQILHEGQPHLVLWDRIPGASGLTRAVADRHLGDLLRLSRLVLERLVGPELGRLRALYDPRNSHAEGWDVREALILLDRALDPPPVPSEERRMRGDARVGRVPGEGSRGDLGRLWIAPSGRTEDLVWTRHRWSSSHALGEAPAGEVFLDIAFERQSIAAAALGAEAERDAGELAEVRAALARLAGDRLARTVLELVAHMPTSPRALEGPERAPLLVLARRRADRPAKLALAQALLPADLGVERVQTPAGEALRLTLDGERKTVRLEGRTVRELS